MPLPDSPLTLSAWLQRIEQLHPEEIELGLDRIRSVCAPSWLKPAPVVVTVAGTNGKGSVVALLEAMYAGAGYQIGTYTSPHLVDFNERIRINRAPVGDGVLLTAFAEVEKRRGNVALTYFEFTTLAALQIFSSQELDLVILETGLGGRLDATNVVDTDLGVITTVDLDHQAWLGADREAIGREKAGILRRGKPAVYGAKDPPQTVVDHAHRLCAPLHILGQHFDWEAQGQHWTWRGVEQPLRAALPMPALKGRHQLDNAATALMSAGLLQSRLPLAQQQVRLGLLDVALPGRMQVIPGEPVTVLDVAHNPQAAQALANTLLEQPFRGRTLALCALLGDKDAEGVLRPLLPLVDEWHLADSVGARGQTAQDLAVKLQHCGCSVPVHCWKEVAAAYAKIRADAASEDRILIFGSFQAVGGILSAIAHDTGVEA